MSEIVYQLDSISREFRADAERVQAIREVNLSVKRGEFLAICGRSGAGKSTLLGILGLMDRPSSGRMQFCGQSVAEMKTKEIDALRRGSIGFLFQQDLLIPHLTVFENLALPLRYNGWSAASKNKIYTALNSVGLPGKESRRPQQLSGGERTRAALARAIVVAPRVLLADEPTGALDSETATAIMTLLKGLHATGMTVIVVTHDSEVAGMATRVVQIKDGRAHD
jgi:ABC-type lipoprotein export system ATPase subunit